MFPETEDIWFIQHYHMFVMINLHYNKCIYFIICEVTQFLKSCSLCHNNLNILIALTNKFSNHYYILNTAMKTK